MNDSPAYDSHHIQTNAIIVSENVIPHCQIIAPVLSHRRRASVHNGGALRPADTQGGGYGYGDTAWSATAKTSAERGQFLTACVRDAREAYLLIARGDRSSSKFFSRNVRITTTTTMTSLTLLSRAAFELLIIVISSLLISGKVRLILEFHSVELTASG